ncbi:Elongation of very long chain fatty acids protein [Dirofilaria immitis]|nr:Elongation of very long chain fatty acids protein [Dirofilaria immitis]
MAQWEYLPYYGLENYLYTTSFEAKFNMMESTKWMQENWFHSITSSIAYVISIYIGQKLMESRKPFRLDNLLIAWNLGLAFFSLLGVCRMTPELLWSVRENSFEYSICTASFAQGVTGFWTEMFALSKVAEFGDTVFNSCANDHTASGRWFIWMNYTVHAFMYTYYALRAMRKRLPKMAAMMVTILQILQMVGGVFIGINILRIKLSGRDCQQTWSNLYFSFTIYFSYFLLFCNFFYNTYLKKGNRYHAVLADGIGNKTQKDMITEERSKEKMKLKMMSMRRSGII